MFHHAAAGFEHVALKTAKVPATARRGFHFDPQHVGHIEREQRQ